MSYRHTKFKRVFQKYFLILQQEIIFKISHISPAGKISILGIIIFVFSLFRPWIVASESIFRGVTPITSATSFSPFLGNIGFVMLGIIILIAFSIISLKKKEKLFFLGMFRMSEQFCTLYGGIILGILSLQSFLFIQGLQIFSSQISYASGIIFSFIGTIFLIIGSIMYKKEFRKNIKGTYSSDIEKTAWESQSQERKNMKLPF